MAYNMGGKYPLAANYLIYTRRAKDSIYVRNVVTEDVAELDESACRFLKGLDGNTDPVILGEKYGIDVEEAMDFFEFNNLLRTDGRKLSCFPMENLTTCYVPAVKRARSIVPKLINFSLLLMWCPVLLLGIHCYMNKGFPLSERYILIGLLFGFMIAFILHEAGHAISCLAYGGYFFEAGLSLSFWGIGAYAMLDYSKIRSMLKKVQISVAGAEMNLLLGGVFLILASFSPMLSGFFQTSALVNIALGVSNLSCVYSFDGCTAMLDLLGLEGGLETAQDVLEAAYYKSEKHKPDTIDVLICVVMWMFQLILPLIICYYLLVIVGIFI